MATDKPRFYITLPTSAADILENTSKETGLSKSQLISILISKHLNKEKQNLLSPISHSDNNKNTGE